MNEPIGRRGSFRPLRARRIASELGLSDRSRFVQANLYDARAALPEPNSFDRVFVSWGALCWLPDIAEWARIVAFFLKPGGWLALAEAHPVAYVFDSSTKNAAGLPGYYVPYFGREPAHEDHKIDYADKSAVLTNTCTMEWLHPLSDTLGGLMAAGLRIESFDEHDSCAWQLFDCLRREGPGRWCWPDRPWLPLSFSLRAVKPA